MKKGDLGGFKDFQLIMEDFLLRYPQKGDSLFRENVSRYHYINLDPYVSLGPLGDNWYKYISGYKDAADILLDKIINNSSIQDLLAFPTIFLYRHCIELSMKLIIRYGYELYDIKNDYEASHALEDLWNDCRLIIEKNWPKEYYEILNATGNIIKEFSKIDPTSIETRYPEKKTIKKKKKSKNNKIIETDRDRILTMEGISNINLKNMKELMEKIYIFLGAMGDAISIELSEKREIDSEYNFD